MKTLWYKLEDDEGNLILDIGKPDPAILPLSELVLKKAREDSNLGGSE